jgi:large subunit ribosomal protein L25
MIPAVVYGRGLGSIPVEVDARQVDGILSSGAGRNSLIDFHVAGDEGAYTVMLKDIQYDPVRRGVVHADFQQVNLSEKINTTIPVILVGEVKEGVLQQVKRELEISCLPAEIPESITVNVAGLLPGSTLKVSDLIIPPGVKVLDEGGEFVATVLTAAEKTVDVDVPDEKVSDEAVEKE